MFGANSLPWAEKLALLANDDQKSSTTPNQNNPPTNLKNNNANSTNVLPNASRILGSNPNSNSKKVTALSSNQVIQEKLPPLVPFTGRRRQEFQNYMNFPPAQHSTPIKPKDELLGCYDASE